jgi:hypothetical protein
MRRNILAVWSLFCFLLIGLALLQSSAHAQAGFNDDRVILQGFYWESHRHGDPKFPNFGQKNS